MLEAPILLYGPSGSGKSTIGARLAGALGVPFFDLDREIEMDCGRQVFDIFKSQGEGEFRNLERRHLQQVLMQNGVIALGGGALLDPACRSMAETYGQVVVMSADANTLCSRLNETVEVRPLLSGDCRERLEEMLEARGPHYASFAVQVDTTGLTPDETLESVQSRLGIFHIQGIQSMGSSRAGQEDYDVIVRSGSLDSAGEYLRRRGLRDPILVVSDKHVGKLYLPRILETLRSVGYAASGVELPPGEEHKRIETISSLWNSFVYAGLERGSTVLALGGGVISDMTGFAAAGYLRGMRWVALPTSLLGMVDASIGGKTGIDLPEGKNLAGAFHAPALVLADPNVLASLPLRELRCGMAEVLKHGIIADVGLFEACETWDITAPAGGMESIVRRAAAVKVKVVQADPNEQNMRAVLNLGHTIGHAVEQASGYQLRHGEAVGIGLVIEARLSENMRIAKTGVAGTISRGVQKLGLPVEIPAGLKADEIIAVMNRDKKKSSGRVKFAMPVKIGEVRHGIDIEEEYIWEAVCAGIARTQP